MPFDGKGGVAIMKNWLLILALVVTGSAMRTIRSHNESVERTQKSRAADA